MTNVWPIFGFEFGTIAGALALEDNDIPDPRLELQFHSGESIADDLPDSSGPLRRKILLNQCKWTVPAVIRTRNDNSSSVCSN